VDSLEEDLEVGRLFVREQDVAATVEDMVAIMVDLVETQEVTLGAAMEVLVATQEVTLEVTLVDLEAKLVDLEAILVDMEAAVEVLVEILVDMEEVAALPTADMDRTVTLVTILDLPVDSSILTTQDPVVDTQEVSVEERLKKTPMIVSSLVDRRLIYH